MVSKKIKTSLKDLKFGLLAVAVTVVFVGCSNNNEPIEPNPLRGVWEYVDKYEYEYEGEWKGDTITATTLFTFNLNWTFSNDRSLKFKNGAVINNRLSSGTYSIYDKDKVVFSTKDANNVDWRNTIPFRIEQDYKGEYLVFDAPTYIKPHKYYKK